MMIAAPKPLVVTISHQLGRDGAKRRLDDGLGQIWRRLAPFSSSIDYRWVDYRLDFGVKALRQSISGHIDVEDDILRIELELPVLLHLLSASIARRIRGEGARLLDKPVS